MIALESAEWFDLQHNFLFYNFKAKALPIGIGSQTENTIKGGVGRQRDKMYGKRENGLREAGDCDLPVLPPFIDGRILVIKSFAQNDRVEITCRLL